MVPKKDKDTNIKFQNSIQKATNLATQIQITTQGSSCSPSGTTHITGKLKE